MNYKHIYIILVLILLVYLLYTYMDIQDKHNYELKRIEVLQKKLNQKKNEVENARANTTECPIPELNSPKECYIDSNYNCKWSIEADRCNLIK